MDVLAEASALPDSPCVKSMQNVQRGKKGSHAIWLNKPVNIPSRISGGGGVLSMRSRLSIATGLRLAKRAAPHVTLIARLTNDIGMSGTKRSRSLREILR
jgi:hypothetical protein